jgi:hypothetical protein
MTESFYLISIDIVELQSLWKGYKLLHHDIVAFCFSKLDVENHKILTYHLGPIW